MRMAASGCLLRFGGFPMPHGYTEDPLVEQPSIELLAELGWATGLRVCGCQPARRMAE